MGGRARRRDPRVWEGRVHRTRDHGETWTELSTGSTKELHFIWGTSAKDVWTGGGNSLAGDDGVLLHSTDGGATWREEVLPTRAPVFAAGGKPGEIYVLAQGGRILRRTGS